MSHRAHGVGSPTDYPDVGVDVVVGNNVVEEDDEGDHVVEEDDVVEEDVEDDDSDDAVEDDDVVEADPVDDVDSVLDPRGPPVVLLELDVCGGTTGLVPLDDPLVLVFATPLDSPAPGTHSSASPIPASEPNLRPDGHAGSSKPQYPGASQIPAWPPTLHSSSSVHWKTEAAEQLHITRSAARTPNSRTMAGSYQISALPGRTRPHGRGARARLTLRLPRTGSGRRHDALLAADGDYASMWNRQQQAGEYEDKLREVVAR